MYFSIFQPHVILSLRLHFKEFKTIYAYTGYPYTKVYFLFYFFVIMLSLLIFDCVT